MIFSKILKFADVHVAKMKADKSMNKKKSAIAKYSFLSGFQTAMLMYGENSDASIYREEKREENTHQPEQLSKLESSQQQQLQESLPGDSTP